jgi:hypothetical protein
MKGNPASGRYASENGQKTAVNPVPLFTGLFET